MTPDEYRQVLDAAWADHLAPRAVDAPTVVSTFAGCGGSSLGYSMAGYRELAAVEWEQHAADTFRANFPGVPLWQGDIAQLTIETLRGIVGDVEVDVLDGSPPCQGFSTTNKNRSIDDPRNRLFKEFVRLLRDLRPRIFVMENVRGIRTGRMKRTFVEIIDELTISGGYGVRAAELKAESYGVPQTRPRTIFIGVRDDIGIAPTFPPPSMPRVIALREAVDLGAIDPIVFDPPMPAFDDNYARVTHLIGQGRSASDLIGSGFSCHRNHADHPSFTLTKTNTGRGYGTIVHPTKHRSHSIDEAKTIHSFPAAFVLSGTYQEQWARIGNSVPPLMMRAIAEHVKGLLGVSAGTVVET